MANVKSLSDFNGDASDSDSDHNDYYAGGEKSGQLIRGAGDDKGKKDKVGALFDQARKVGAEHGTAEDLAGPSGAFRGTGRTLAGDTAQAEDGGPRTHVITFYRNEVFTVDDGPPRSVDDPANLPFLDAISRGECPRELDPGPSGPAVTVNLLRKEEDYQAPKKPQYVAFSGTGRSLGSAGASSSSAAAPEAAPAPPPGEWEGVRPELPSTSLQIRLADGSRMVARFNTTHTLADVRRFIRASRPDIDFPYVLVTGFPAAPVADESATLEAAGLMNAVLIQRKQ